MKLYLVTRKDLPPGAQAAQLVHGMAEFAEEHPETFKAWKEASNTVVCLSVRDEEKLHALASEACAAEHRFSLFHEPDFGNAVTVVVLEPKAEALVKDLRLALG